VDVRTAARGKAGLCKTWASALGLTLWFLPILYGVWHTKKGSVGGVSCAMVVQAAAGGEAGLCKPRRNEVITDVMVRANPTSKQLTARLRLTRPTSSLPLP